MPSPRKLDAAMIERLAEAVGSGLPDKFAAQLCGLSPSTVKAWRAQGRTATPQSLLSRLDRKLAQADSEFIRVHLAKVAEAKSGSWQASAWLLERKFQNEFALVQRVETGEPGSFAKMSSDQLRAKIVELLPAITKKSGA